MAALIETRDDEDEDGTAVFYTDGGTDEVEELGDETDEPLDEGDEDEDEDEEPSEESE